MRYLRWFLIIALISLAFFQLKPHFAEFKNFTNYLANVNYFWLVAAAVLIVGQYFGDGWLSQILLKIAGHKIDLKTTLKIASIDVFAAHILPIGEAGVVATAAYFYKKLGVSNQNIIFLTIAWGLVTNIVLAIFLLIAMLFLPKLPNVPIHLSNLAKLIISVAAMALLFTLNFRKFILDQLAKRFATNKIYQEIQVFIQNLDQHKDNIGKNKMLTAQAAAAALVYYIANIVSLYFCFLAFGTTLNMAIVTFAYLLSLVTSFITLAPAGIGTSEATMILIFLQFGTSPAIATASVLAFRFFAFWLPIPAGAFAYLSLKKQG